MCLQDLGFRNLAKLLAVEVPLNDLMMYVTIAPASACVDGLPAGSFKPPFSGDLGLKVHHESDDPYVVPISDWDHVPAAMMIIESLPDTVVECIFSDLRL